MPTETKDGRTLRAERSRQKIVDAIVALVDEGTLIPTAQQVAEMAAVGIRTVFRHFNEMDDLMIAVDQQVRADYMAAFAGGNRNGPLETRIENLVAHFGKAFEKTGNLHRSMHAQSWRINILHTNYQSNVVTLKKNLLDWLPELTECPEPLVDAATVALSFETWYRLRSVQRLNVKSARAAVESTLKALLRDKSAT